MVTSVNVTAVRAALTSLDAFRARKEKSRPIVAVAIPELADTAAGEEAVTVFMRAMSGSQREEWGLRQIVDENYEPDEELLKQKQREKTWGEVIKGSKTSLIAHTIVDPDNGRLIFAYAEDELGELNAAALERLYAKAIQLNGLPRNQIADYLKKWLEETDARDAAPAAVALEERVGNSASVHIDASS